MTILPALPRRAWLRGFLLVTMAGVTAAITAAALLVTVGAAIVLVPVTAVALVGWRRPSILRLPYRVWNAMASRVERVLRLAVLLAAYYAVIVPAGWTGTAMALERPAVGQSLWEPYPASGRAAYFHPYAATVDGGRGAGWVARYVKWAMTSGNAWMVALLPFLWLLSKVDAKQTQSDVPTDIYTLA